MNLFRLLRQIIAALRDKLEMMSHNEYSAAKYFRNQGAQIGENCRILVEELGGEPYLVRIGNNVTIAPHVSLITHDASAGLFRKEIPELNIFGTIDIKDNCFIGYGSIILYNVTIGPNSVVGAGSVVTKDVPPNTVVAGVPAHPITTVDKYRERVVAQWQQLGLKGDRSTWKQQLIRHFWSKQEKE